MNDAQLKKAILAAGVVSWFLGKKVLTEGETPPSPLPNMALVLLALGMLSRNKRRRAAYYRASWWY